MRLHRLLACAAALALACGAALAAASEAVPPKAVLVFENARYQRQLAAALGSSPAASDLELVDCSGRGATCNPPPAELAERVVAVVVANPRNASTFALLPKAELLQLAWYILPPLEAIPARMEVAMYVNGQKWRRCGPN